MAFNNFIIAEFRQIPKQDEQGKGYTGLEIKMIKTDGTTTTEVVEDME